MEIRYAGRHLILELWGVENNFLTECDLIGDTLTTAAETAKATVLHTHFHHFGEGYGVTGVIVLAESHISIHTWPEHNYAAIDIFMCGDCNPLDAMDVILDKFKPQKYDTKVLIRGQFNL